MTASATAPPGIPHASERTRRLLDFDCPLLSNVNAHAQALSMGATRTFLSTNPFEVARRAVSCAIGGSSWKPDMYAHRV
jgi:hypothetical protein